MGINNCLAHPNVQNLKATEMLFLPPNATSTLQPCDQGIIQNLKVRYRSTMLLRLVQHIDAGASATDFSVTLLCVRVRGVCARRMAVGRRATLSARQAIYIYIYTPGKQFCSVYVLYNIYI